MKLFAVIFLLMNYAHALENQCHIEKNLRDGSYMEIKIADQLLIDVESYREFDNFLFYATRHFFGKPEIGVLECSSGKKVTIIKPKTITKSYPDGADFFRINKVRKVANGFVVEYYHGAHVEKVDFKRFGETRNLKFVTFKNPNLKLNIASMKRKQ